MDVAYFTCALNSFIHILMYTYYLLALIIGKNPKKRQKYLWWGKYMTLFQMAQFLAMSCQAVYCYFVTEFPRFLHSLCHSIIFCVQVLMCHSIDVLANASRLIRTFLCPEACLQIKGQIKLMMLQILNVLPKTGMMLQCHQIRAVTSAMIACCLIQPRLLLDEAH